MNLDRENMKKLMLLITFTVVLLVGVQRLDVVLGTLNVIWTIFLPFVLGSAIGFFLNVPMAFREGRNGWKTCSVTMSRLQPGSIVLK